MSVIYNLEPFKMELLNATMQQQHVSHVGNEITYPKVPATSVQIICDDEVDAHLASPKSESCMKNQQDNTRPEANIYK